MPSVFVGPKRIVRVHTEGMRWTRRLALATGLAVAALGIAVPLSLSGGNAAAAPTPATTLSVPHAPHALKQDLRQAWQAPDGQRVAALKAVLQQALAGDYGTRVRLRAQRLQQRLGSMDPQLRADLEHAIDLPKAQRQAAMRAVKQKLKDGAYGKTARRDARFLHRARAHHRFG